MGKQFTAWSPSRLRDYDKCPAFAKYKYLDKLDEGPESEAIARGNEIDAAAEQYITSRTKELHPALQGVKKLINELRKEYQKNRVKVQLELALDKSWKVVTWFAKESYVRVKMDVLWILGDGKLQVIDWKTGRFKPDDPNYNDQLNLYSVAALSTNLGKEASAKLVFTDHGEEIERDSGFVILNNLPKEQKKWDKRAKPMLADTRFAPSPGNHCRWCNFSRNKGGPCLY